MKHQKEIETIGQAHLRHDAQDILATLAPLEVHHPTTYQVCICEGGGKSCQNRLWVTLIRLNIPSASN